ncbi:MAG: hypothetical protein RKL32_01400, partial [Gammaproteobacteria bacterium]
MTDTSPYRLAPAAACSITGLATVALCVALLSLVPAGYAEEAAPDGVPPTAADDAPDAAAASPAASDTVAGDVPRVPEAALAADTAAPGAERDGLASTVESLEAFLKTIESKEAEVARLRERFQAAADDVTRDRLLERLAEATREAEALERQFERFAVDVDVSAFAKEDEDQGFDWQEELSALVRPIVAELKSATAESRVIGELRSAIEDASEREDTAKAASSNLEALVESASAGALRERLERDLARWRQRHEDARNRRVALELQLDKRLAERTSVLDQTASYAKSFFRERGLNLVMGIGAFLVVFLGVRLLGRLYDRIYAARRGRTFSNRLGTLLFHVFSVVGGLGATLLVFNLVGDWFLLGILVIFLLGIGWASINTLPAHVETIKLMLNIGAVREGERLVFDASPWRVDHLGFSARLVNPLLDGGVQILPVRFLVGMHSRPLGQDEEWFPCRQGDWVELDDGRIGRVAWQSPAQVQLVELGGAQVTYQTADFLARSPRNLSTGFRLELSFGIDYAHQADATTTIPHLMQEKVEHGLREAFGAAMLRNVRVEFQAAAASSRSEE